MTATLKTTIIKDPSATVDNITLDVSGNATIGADAVITGKLGVGGTNYGTSGQVLTSAGSSASPTWADLAIPSGVFPTSVQTFTTSGTYTPTSGTTSAIMFVLGGGGGGGGADNDNDGSGGGGGGCVVAYIDPTAFASIGTPTVTIGAGGTGGGTTAYGGDGGNTLVGTIVEAEGGKGGQAQSTESGRGGSFATMPQKAYVIPGGNGNSSGPAGGDDGGAGGCSAFGIGGNGGSGSQNGSPGTGYGAGGGGAASPDTTNRTGGAGTGGYVMIWEYT